MRPQRPAVGVARNAAAHSSSWALAWPALSRRFVCKRVFPVEQSTPTLTPTPTQTLAAAHFSSHRLLGFSFLSISVFVFAPFLATFHFPFSVLENCLALLTMLIISMIYFLFVFIIICVRLSLGRRAGSKNAHTVSDIAPRAQSQLRGKAAASAAAAAVWRHHFPIAVSLSVCFSLLVIIICMAKLVFHLLFVICCFFLVAVVVVYLLAFGAF